MIAATLTEQPGILKSAALLPPRLTLGSTMVFHGLSKLKKEGTEKHVPFFEQLGFKPGRPWVCTLSWNCVASLVGRAPMRPTGACTFCCWIAAMISDGARFRLVSRVMSNQTRIE